MKVGGEGGVVAAGRTGKSGVVTTGRSGKMGKSRYDGFSLSTETVSLRPLRSSIKCLGDFSKTLKGPSYGDWSGFLPASYRTNTWNAVLSSPVSATSERVRPGSGCGLPYCVGVVYSNE